MTYTQCIDCAYWRPFLLTEDGRPARSRLLHDGRCHVQLPPYLMRRQPADFNTNPDEGCDLGQFGPTWLQEEPDADPQV